MIIALTGGIGSGKSEASKQFAKLGVPVVDLDVIAHALTAVGEPLLQDIKKLFGTDYFNIDGSLNRVKLREHVFKNIKERLKLENLMHPAIYKVALYQLGMNENELHPAYQILVIPLFFESNHYKGIADKVLAIDCDESSQILRAMSRSNLTESEVKNIMNSQINRNERINSTDELIVNNGTLIELHEKINAFHKKLIKTCIVSK